MSHDYHEALPGYNSEQILCDGCHECEWRSKRYPAYGIAHLDSDSFVRAWKRAAEWNTVGLSKDKICSYAEMPMLNVLWEVQCQLERLGVPVGQIAQYFSYTRVEECQSSLAHCGKRRHVSGKREGENRNGKNDIGS